MTKEVSIVWFRQDLRLSDNPALSEALAHGKIFPIYIFDDCAPAAFKIGEASKIWLHHSLNNLNTALNRKLNIYIGKAGEAIKSIIEKQTVSNVYYNSGYEPWHIKQEQEIQEMSSGHKARFESRLEDELPKTKPSFSMLKIAASIAIIVSLAVSGYLFLETDTSGNIAGNDDSPKKIMTLILIKNSLV